jgi:hypothetical protein
VQTTPRISHTISAIALSSFIGVLLVLFASVQLLGQPLVPTRWYRIRTPHTDIIFRGDMGREAQRMANTLEYLYAPTFHPLEIRNSRVALILNNQKVNKNGFTQLAPYKMSFDTFPTQDYNFIGSNDWLHVLATHEFRHAAQYVTLQRKFNRLAYILGGELFVTGSITANVPLWLFEGDAVDRETELTASGRGRIPYFLLRYKTNLLTQKEYGYDQQHLGSFKNPLPDHYRIGYLLTAHLRNNYGDKILTEIFKKTTLPMPFPMAVKKLTGRGIGQIYKDMNQVLQTHWQKQLEGLEFTKTTRLNPRSRADYIDYTYPQLDKKGHVIVLKSGIGTVAQFVALDCNKRPHKILTPGNIDTKISFSVAQNKMVWIEEMPDIRWKDRSYGVIKCYDTQTKRLKTLTHKSRYGSAELSPDATKIVAFESDMGYHHHLVIIDAENGQVLQRLPNPDNHCYLTPKWSEDGKQIVVVKNVQQKVTIALIDISTGATKNLLPYSTELLGCPVMKGHYVLYNSAYSGIDNIYAIDLATRQQYQVTSSQYGAYHPSISADSQWLLFNDFKEDGMDAVKIPFTPQQWTPLAQIEKHAAHAYAPSIAQEDSGDFSAHVPTHTHFVERYHPWQHALNVHSWLNFNISLNTEDPHKFSEYVQRVGLDILRAKNLLDTTELVVNYLHDFKHKWGQADVKIIYEGLYPIISLTGSLKENYQKTPTCHRSLLLRLEIPWTLQHGQYTYKPLIAATSTLQNNARATWCTQTYEGSCSRNSKKSPKDIYLPWAQKGTVKYEHMPYEGDSPCLQATTELTATLHFPGLAKHHSLRWDFGYGYAKETFKQAAIENALRIKPLGWYDCTRQRRQESISTSVRYALPICYPDWSMSPFLYVKRLRAETSYRFQCSSKTENIDHIYGPLPDGHVEYGLPNRLKRIKNTPPYKTDIALELFADLHPFTLLNLPQISLGIQYRYLIEQRAGEFHAVLSMGVIV